MMPSRQFQTKRSAWEFAGRLYVSRVDGGKVGRLLEDGRVHHQRQRRAAVIVTLGPRLLRPVVVREAHVDRERDSKVGLEPSQPLE